MNFTKVGCPLQTDVEVYVIWKYPTIRVLEPAVWNLAGTSPGMRAVAPLVAVGVILRAFAKFVREMGQVRRVYFSQ